MEEITLKKYEEMKREIALEILEVLKSRNLSVALADDTIEYTKRYIHRTTKL
ncbi:hypothetical protein [uncultured Robinsoniella sp.]|uniref:hypothetical protein n=1 Tax=uncultured Robinsoniella sp. TaxID=904190 RepID=UPI00291011FD|nr:hypothetical protein [Clostridiales bacterium]